MAVFRPKNNYVTDYEDTGFEPTIDEIIAQIVAPTPVVTPVAQVEQKPMTTAEVVKELVASGTFEQNPNQAVLIDGTYYQPNFASTGSGETFEQGPLENVTVYKEAENKVGGDVNQYSPSGEYQQTTKQQEVNAVKDLMDFAAIAGTMFGVPAGIGEALGLSGATGAAVGQGALTTATQLGGGESLGDALKAGLVSGGLAYGGSLMGDATPTTQVSNAELNAASDIASTMADEGLSIGQISQQLESVGYQPEAIRSALEDAINIIATQPTPVETVAEPIYEPVVQPVLPDVTAPIETVQVTAPIVPPTVNDVISQIATSVATQTPIETVQVNTQAQQPQTINDVISQIVAQLPIVTPVPEQTPFSGTITSPIETVQVTAPQAPVEPTITDVINSIIQAQVAPQPEIPEVVQTAERPQQPEQPTIPVVVPTMPEVVVTDQRPTTDERPITIQPPSSITEDTTPIPVITPSKPIDTTIPEKKYTTAEIVDMVRLGLAGAGLLAGANAASSGPKQYDIVPVPEDWKSPVYQKDLPTTAPTQLPPIDFGNRNLLIGTQWEKFLDPNYGKIPAPVQFNQPSNMSYDRLMGILGTGRDTLPSQVLSINDVISGIQNQYGQKP
jgi:hypothetical protein